MLRELISVLKGRRKLSDFPSLVNYLSRGDSKQKADSQDS